MAWACLLRRRSRWLRQQGFAAAGKSKGHVDEECWRQSSGHSVRFGGRSVSWDEVKFRYACSKGRFHSSEIAELSLDSQCCLNPFGIQVWMELW